MYDDLDPPVRFRPTAFIASTLATWTAIASILTLVGSTLYWLVVDLDLSLPVSLMVVSSLAIAISLTLTKSLANRL